MYAILTTETWRHRARMARSRGERLLGMTRGGHRSMIFETRSVHGFGMPGPLRVLAIASDSTVIGSRVLLPNRVVFFGGARYILELPLVDEVPPAGTSLQIGFEDG